MCWSELVDRLSRAIAEQAIESGHERSRSDRVEAALAVDKWGQPFIGAGEQRGVREVWDRLIVHGGEGGTLPQSNGTLAPRQNGEPVAANSLDKSGLDRGLVGPGIGYGRQADRAQPAALGRAGRGG